MDSITKTNLQILFHSFHLPSHHLSHQSIICTLSAFYFYSTFQISRCCLENRLWLVVNHVYHYLKGCHCDSFCLEYHCILLFSVQGTSVPSEHLGLYICTEMSPSGDFLDHPVWRGTCYFLSLNFAFYFHDICVKFKAMAPHSSTLAWKIPWMEEPGRLQSMGSLRVGHDWATSLSLFTCIHWRRKWQPTPVFLPGESQGQGTLVGCRLWGRTVSDTTEAT